MPRREIAPADDAPTGNEACRRWISVPSMVDFPFGAATVTERAESVLEEVARALRAHPEIDGLYVVGVTHHRHDPDPTPALGMARARAIAEWLFGAPGGVSTPALVVVAGGVSTDDPCGGWGQRKKCSAIYRYATFAMRVPRACEPGEAPSLELPDPRPVRPNIEHIEEAVFTPAGGRDNEGPAAPF